MTIFDPLKGTDDWSDSNPNDETEPFFKDGRVTKRKFRDGEGSRRPGHANLTGTPSTLAPVGSTSVATPSPVPLSPPLPPISGSRTVYSPEDGSDNFGLTGPSQSELDGRRFSSRPHAAPQGFDEDYVDFAVGRINASLSSPYMSHDAADLPLAGLPEGTLLLTPWDAMAHPGTYNPNAQWRPENAVQHPEVRPAYARKSNRVLQAVADTDFNEAHPAPQDLWDLAPIVSDRLEAAAHFLDSIPIYDNPSEFQNSYADTNRAVDFKSDIRNNSTASVAAYAFASGDVRYAGGKDGASNVQYSERAGFNSYRFEFKPPEPDQQGSAPRAKRNEYSQSQIPDYYDLRVENESGVMFWGRAGATGGFAILPQASLDDKGNLQVVERDEVLRRLIHGESDVSDLRLPYYSYENLTGGQLSQLETGYMTPQNAYANDRVAIADKLNARFGGSTQYAPRKADSSLLFDVGRNIRRNLAVYDDGGEETTFASGKSSKDAWRSGQNRGRSSAFVPAAGLRSKTAAPLAQASGSFGSGEDHVLNVAIERGNLFFPEGGGYVPAGQKVIENYRSTVIQGMNADQIREQFGISEGQVYTRNGWTPSGIRKGDVFVGGEITNEMARMHIDMGNHMGVRISGVQYDERTKSGRILWSTIDDTAGAEYKLGPGMKIMGQGRTANDPTLAAANAAFSGQFGIDEGMVDIVFGEQANAGRLNANALAMFRQNIGGDWGYREGMVAAARQYGFDTKDGRERLLGMLDATRDKNGQYRIGDDLARIEQLAANSYYEGMTVEREVAPRAVEDWRLRAGISNTLRGLVPDQDAAAYTAATDQLLEARVSGSALDAAGNPLLEAGQQFMDRYFTSLEQEDGYWMAGTRSRFAVGQMVGGPLAVTTSGEARYTGEQANLINRMSPEALARIESFDESKFNWARGVMRAQRANTAGDIGERAIDGKIIDSKDIDIGSYFGAAALQGVRPEDSGATQRYVLEKLVEEHGENTYVKFGDKGYSAPLGAALAMHQQILETNESGETYVSAVRGYGNTLLNTIQAYNQDPDNADVGRHNDALEDVATTYQMKENALRMTMPGFTGAIQGVQGLPSNTAVVNRYDFIRNLTKMGYEGDALKAAIRQFDAGGATGLFNQYPQSEGEKDFFGLTYVDVRQQRKVAGFESLVVSPGGIGVSQELSGAAKKDMDGDTGQGVYIDGITPTPRSEIDARAAGSVSREIQSIMDKAASGVGTGRVDTPEFVEQGATAVSKISSGTAEGALSQQEMAFIFGPFVRGAQASANAMRDSLPPELAGIGDQIFNSVARSGASIYQMALDKDPSKDPASGFLRNVLRTGGLKTIRSRGKNGFAAGPNLKDPSTNKKVELGSTVEDAAVHLLKNMVTMQMSPTGNAADDFQRYAVGDEGETPYVDDMVNQLLSVDRLAAGAGPQLREQLVQLAQNGGLAGIQGDSVDALAPIIETLTGQKFDGPATRRIPKIAAAVRDYMFGVEGQNPDTAMAFLPRLVSAITGANNEDYMATVNEGRAANGQASVEMPVGANVGQVGNLAAEGRAFRNASVVRGKDKVQSPTQLATAAGALPDNGVYKSEKDFVERAIGPTSGLSVRDSAYNKKSIDTRSSRPPTENEESEARALNNHYDIDTALGGNSISASQLPPPPPAPQLPPGQTGPTPATPPAPFQGAMPKPDNVSNGMTGKTLTELMLPLGQEPPAASDGYQWERNGVFDQGGEMVRGWALRSTQQGSVQNNSGETLVQYDANGRFLSQIKPGTVDEGVTRQQALLVTQGVRPMSDVEQSRVNAQLSQGQLLMAQIRAGHITPDTNVDDARFVTQVFDQLDKASGRAQALVNKPDNVGQTLTAAEKAYYDAVAKEAAPLLDAFRPLLDPAQDLIAAEQLEDMADPARAKGRARKKNRSQKKYDEITSDQLEEMLVTSGYSDLAAEMAAPNKSTRSRVSRIHKALSAMSEADRTAIGWDDAKTEEVAEWASRLDMAGDDLPSKPRPAAPPKPPKLNNVDPRQFDAAMAQMGTMGEQFAKLTTIMEDLNEGSRRTIATSSDLVKTYDVLSDRVAAINQNAKNGKAPSATEKLELMQWDMLNKQVLSNGKTVEQTMAIGGEFRQTVAEAAAGKRFSLDERQEMQRLQLFELLGGTSKAQQKERALAFQRGDYDDFLSPTLGAGLNRGVAQGFGAVARGFDALMNPMTGFVLNNAMGRITEQQGLARQYESKIRADAYTLMDSGAMTYGQAMGTEYGDILRRSARSSEWDYNNQQAAYGIWSPIWDTLQGAGGTSSRNMAALNQIGQFSLGVGGLGMVGGMIAKAAGGSSLLGLAGTATGGGLTALGATSMAFAPAAALIAAAVAGTALAGTNSTQYLLQGERGDIGGVFGEVGSYLGAIPSALFNSGAGNADPHLLSADRSRRSTAYNQMVRAVASGRTSLSSAVADPSLGGLWTTSQMGPDVYSTWRDTLSAQLSWEKGVAETNQRAGSVFNAIAAFDPSASTNLTADQNLSYLVGRMVDRGQNPIQMGVAYAASTGRGITGISSGDISTVANYMADGAMPFTGLNSDIGMRSSQMLSAWQLQASVNQGRFLSGRRNLLDTQTAIDWLGNTNELAGQQILDQFQNNFLIQSPGQIGSNSMYALAQNAFNSGSMVQMQRYTQTPNISNIALGAYTRESVGTNSFMRMYSGLDGDGNLEVSYVPPAVQESYNRVNQAMTNNVMARELNQQQRSSALQFMGSMSADSVFRNSGTTALADQMASDVSRAYAAGLDPMHLTSSRLSALGMAPNVQNLEDIADSIFEEIQKGFTNPQELANLVNEDLSNPVRAQVNASRRMRGLDNITFDDAEKDLYANNAEVGQGRLSVEQTLTQLAGSGTLFGDYAQRREGRLVTLAETNPAEAMRISGQYAASNQIYSNYATHYGDSIRFAGIMDMAADNLDPVEFGRRQAAASGDLRALSAMAGPGSPLSMYDMRTGFTVFDKGINATEFSRLAAVNPRLAALTDPALMEQGVFGMQNELQEIQRSNMITQRQFEVRGQELNRYMTIGFMGELNKDGSTSSGSLHPLAQTFREAGMTFNPGDGRTQWQLEDASYNLRREKQQFQMSQQGQQLDIQRQRFDTAGRQFYEKWDFNKAQFEYGTGYNRREMQIGRGIQVEQQSWQAEDLAYGRSQMEIGFAWQMEDFDRNIRYARGREKRDLMRQQGRAVIQHSMQMGQQDRQEERFGQQVEWADKEFERKKEHFEKTTEFQKQEMEMSKRHFEENRKFDQMQLQMSQQAHQRELQWMAEEWGIEEQTRVLSRQSALFSMNEQQRLSQVMYDANLRASQLQVGLSLVSFNVSYLQTQLQSAGAQAAIFGGQISVLKSLLSVGTQSGNPYGSGYSGPAPVYGFPRYASGGYTGDGGKYEAAGVVHRGEYVVPQQGALVINGADNEERQWRNLVVQLLRKISDNPTTFQAVLSGGSSVPVNPYQSAQSRL
jgi:hypothetical protein